MSDLSLMKIRNVQLKARVFACSGYLQIVLLCLAVTYVWFLPGESLAGIQLDLLGDIVGVGCLTLLALLRIWTVSNEFSHSRIRKPRMNSLAEMTRHPRTIVGLYKELPLCGD